MSRIKHQNIPFKLHGDDREAVAFFQGLLDYANDLVMTGTRIRWLSTATPAGGYLKLDGSTITNSQYPELITYAANDASFTVGATTTVIPTDAGYWIKT